MKAPRHPCEGLSPSSHVLFERIAMGDLPKVMQRHHIYELRKAGLIMRTDEKSFSLTPEGLEAYRAWIAAGLKVIREAIAKSPAAQRMIYSLAMPIIGTGPSPKSRFPDFYAHQEEEERKAEERSAAKARRLMTARARRERGK